MSTHSGATPELRQLDALVGHWNTRGRVLAADPDDEAEILGSDSYEWMPGGHFLLHHVDVAIGGDATYNLEVIGYDAATDRFPTRYFDHEGNTGTYVATLSNGVWTLTTEGARATLTIDSSGRRMHAQWERMDAEGAWQPWMELELTRAESGR